jgi:NADPH2:quinone reductase
VRIAVAGVNFVDIHHRRGTYARKLPFIPGLEGAGMVETIGTGVTTVKPGDRVAYTGQPGAYAEASLVQADSLLLLPDDFSALHKNSTGPAF